MTTMYDADSQELIIKAAEELKKIPEIKAPPWAAFVKTGMHKERPPVKNDWWYTRTASILRAVYRLGPVGVSKLRIKYGGKKNRGVKKEHFFRGSGNILRKSLQQLEKAGFVKFAEKGVHKGRIITPKGISFLDKIAGQMQNLKPRQEIKAVGQPAKDIVEVKQEKSAKQEIKPIEAAKEMAEVKQEQKAVRKQETKPVEKEPAKEMAEVKQEQKAVKRQEQPNVQP